MIITTISHSFLLTFKLKALQNESSTQQPLGGGEAICMSEFESQTRHNTGQLER